VADLFETDLSPASVVSLYLLPDINRKLRPQLWSQQLKVGTASCRTPSTWATSGRPSAPSTSTAAPSTCGPSRGAKASGRKKSA
jgi:hypothetical protein